jgi:hypothetical protein
MNNYFTSLLAGWGKIFSDKRLRYQLLFILAFYILLFKYCRVIMTILEARQGVQVNDFVLNIIPAYDLSMVTFLLTYTALATFLLYSARYPKTLIIGLMGYCLLIMMRTLSIYLVSLDPPDGMILLRDPVTILFMSTPKGGYIVKDLFFSGHVSAVMLFYFVIDNKAVKKFLLILGILISAFLLIQHVHYTMDVVAAPLFAFIACKTSLYINRVYHRENIPQLVAVEV